MTKWILFSWLMNCGWDCNPPVFPPFETWDECQLELVKWLNEDPGRSEREGWASQNATRGGKCIRLEFQSGRPR